MITKEDNKDKTKYIPMLFDVISKVCKKKTVVDPNTRLIDVYNMMKNDIEITEVVVVSNSGDYLGLLTNHFILNEFSGMYGYSLNIRRFVVDLMDRNALTVERSTSIEVVAKLAMSRAPSFVYDSIVVLESEKYLGVVSVKELLETAINIQVKRATECNPLTGLPGNKIIEDKITSLIISKEDFSIIYIDIDNFKAYNDAYGFNNGDLMIKSVSDAMLHACICDDFKGHIGGDDFIIIIKNFNFETICNCIIKEFETSIQSLYSEKDIENGYIISKNRSGLRESFPLATLSIAVIINQLNEFDSLKKLSIEVAKTKKRAKQKIGNCIILT